MRALSSGSIDPAIPRSGHILVRAGIQRLRKRHATAASPARTSIPSPGSSEVVAVEVSGAADPTTDSDVALLTATPTDLEAST